MRKGIRQRDKQTETKRERGKERSTDSHLKGLKKLIEEFEQIEEILAKVTNAKRINKFK